MQKTQSRFSVYAFPATLAGIGVSFVVVMIAMSVNLTSQAGTTGIGSPFTSSHDLKKFSSYSEMSEFLSEVQAYYARVYSYASREGLYAGTPGMTFERMLAPSFGGYVAQQSTTNADSLVKGPVGSDDYSGTNVQVAGIDEADFLKNDGKYVYILSDNTLTIADAYPAEDAKIVSKTSIDIERGQSTQNMFLNGDRLVVFYQAYDRQTISPSTEDNPAYSPTAYEPRTHMLIIDVSDRSAPSELDNYDAAGQYSSARMIGDKIFMLTVGPVDYQRPAKPTVIDSSSSSIIAEPDVYYFDYPQEAYAFNTITMLDLSQLTGSVDDNDNPLLKPPLVSKTFMIGASATVYVSEKNVYLAYQEYLDPPPLRESGIAQYVSPMAPAGPKTAIHKISIQSGSLFEYVGKGEVPGWLLNQFSMDEQGDRLTVATTSEFSSFRGSFIGNNVYKLDERMVTVGKLEGIAESESIYAARFVGDRLYLVTFRQIDPFFVIDLSGDQPKILGELKLPGFSNYLHPYDDDHIIGIGREGSEAGNQGVKIALFDVSDVRNPKTLDTYAIGGLQTDSEVLRDHKALLFDKPRDVLSIPISSFDGYYLDSADPLSMESGPWNGFYVFSMSPPSGIDLKGTIQHNYNGDLSQGGRSFFIKDTLYTVTAGMMKMNDLDNVEVERNSIALGGSGEVMRPLED